VQKIEEGLEPVPSGLRAFEPPRQAPLTYRVQIIRNFVTDQRQPLANASIASYER